MSASRPAPRNAAAPAAFKVALINTYELGRQPFNLAAPAALLKSAGFDVVCLDLAVQRLEPGLLLDAGLVAIHLGMHTAARIAIAALPKIRSLAASAQVCMYGLYAPVNEALLRDLGVQAVLGGETENGLLALAERLRAGDRGAQREPLVDLSRIAFATPDRSGLPRLDRYARVLLPGGSSKVAGFAEATRGCKHLCRHCPIVPVYQGRFRIVDRDVVLSDIEQQVRLGAAHISFGDPDFLNGPAHALRVLQAMHERFPQLSFDATIKIEHIVRYARLLPELRDHGCLFITSAVESIDEHILACLDKHHTRADFERALALCRENGISLSPTFVPFTPWTTLEGYIALLRELVSLRLVEAVPPVQLAMRLLVPRGSYLLRLPGFSGLLDAFDPQLLGYPWRHADPRVDALQKDVISTAMQLEGMPRGRAFEEIWRLAHAALGRDAPPIEADCCEPVPCLSEPWYCCAEPTERQLASI